MQARALAEQRVADRVIEGLIAAMQADGDDNNEQEKQQLPQAVETPIEVRNGGQQRMTKNKKLRIPTKRAKTLLHVMDKSSVLHCQVSQSIIFNKLENR